MLERMRKLAIEVEFAKSQLNKLEDEIREFAEDEDVIPKGSIKEVLDQIEVAGLVIASPYEKIMHRVALDVFENDSVYETNSVGYQKRQKETEAQFRSELAEAYGLSGPIEEKIYNKAWEEGHADGYSEVVSHYDDYADIALLALKQ